MTDKTVKELALSVGIPANRILELIQEAGLPQRKAESIISTQEQDALVSYIKEKRSVDENQGRITLKRRTTSTTRLPSSAKKEKTINVEVRKKHTFIKPDPKEIKLQALQKIKEEHLNKVINYVVDHVSNINIIEIESRVIFDDKSNIIKLDLSNLGINSLEYFDFIDLSEVLELNFNNNNIKEFNIINKMPNVQHIYLSNNPLEKINIQSEISRFDILEGIDPKNILSIELEKNKFTNFILKKNYDKLKKISLKYNLETIDEVIIDCKFKEIEEIDFSNSNIKKFSIIKDLPKSFSALNVGNNLINFLKLPYKIFEIKPDNTYIKVNLEKNNLPDLILSALKKDKLNDQYKELRDIFFDVITVNRVKLIFLGNTGVGKTTLYKILKSEDNDYNEYNGNSTEGVNIFTFDFISGKNKIEVKGFDFGGQDYYHNTHYSFFSSNALYILLWGNKQYIYQRSYYNRCNSENESKLEITYPLNYWLGSVSYFVNKEKIVFDTEFENEKIIKKENLKLYLVQNPNFISNEKSLTNYELNRLSLKNRYPFISGFHDFHPLTSEHFDNYKQEIKENLKSIITSYSTQESYPKILAQIERSLNKKFKKSQEIIVSIDDIQEIFLEENKYIAWEGNFIQILEWLDITMSIYWISPDKLNKSNKNNTLSPDEIDILSRYAVLNLSKLNEIIHDILSSNLYRENHNGYYKRSEIIEILSNFNNHDLADYVSAFMLYNKIYFEAPNLIDNDKFYIAPNYLNEKTTLSEELFLESFDIPFIEYRFEDFYHVNIFTEVLVRYKYNLSRVSSSKNVDYLLWKNKAVLFENLSMSATNQSNKKQPLVFLEFDLGEILDHNSNNPLDDNSDLRKPSIRISSYSRSRQPINDVFLKDIISFIDNHLIGYEYKKFALSPNQIDYVDVESINNCLDNFDGNPTGLFTYKNKIYRSADFSLFTNKKSAMKKIFISHSTEDYKEVQEFITHLQPLKREGLIDHWHCSQLIPNDVWDAEIQKHLWDSDIICMLISPNWLSNEYIFNKELMVAIERKELFKSSYQGRDIVIFPIILKPCMWERIRILSQYQAAPQKAMPIYNFADRDEAWYDVLRKLLDVLNRMDDPDYVPDIGGRLGKFYVKKYEDRATK